MFSKKQKATGVLADQAAARKSRRRGWILFAVFAPLFAVSVPDLFRETDAGDKGMTVMCGFLAILGLWKVYSAFRTDQLQKRFRLYSSFFSESSQKSVAGLSAALNLPRERVLSDLQEMCSRGYFDGFLDMQSECLIFHRAGNEQKNGNVVQCPGCGAVNHIQNEGQHCRYCDTPLHLSV